MADNTPTRRSARGRVPNKKYSTEAIEILNDILNSGSDAEVEPPPEPDTSEDEDFRSDAVAAESEAEEDIASESDAGSDGSGIPTPVEELEGPLSYADPDDLPDIGAGPEPLENMFTHTGLGESKRINKKRNPDSHLHFRGVPGTEKDNSKASHIRFLIGTDLAELQSFSLTRERWTQDSTLPTRKPDRHDKGGMGFPFGLEGRNEEATAEWNWYYEHGGKKAMGRTQMTRGLDTLQIPDYLPRSHPDHSFLMGPYGSQKLCSLKVGEVASLEELWSQTAPEGGEDNVPRNHKRKKNGWMLNIGSKIQCLEWAPGHAGKTQYLALAPAYNPPAKLRGRTAFEASESYPACIQLWAFSSFGEPYPTESMDIDEPPQLVQLLCTNWGAPRQFRWCPIPRAFPNEGQEENIFVGLLAGVWSDGYVRILDLQLTRNNNTSSSHVLYEKAAFASLPPTTICTCLTWLSPTELAVGCANGFVAIWDISETILSSTEPSLSTPPYSPPAPHFYHSLHQSYILSLSSASPQCQHFLASTSIDGYLRLTDIRAPTTDFVLSLRTRNMPPAMDYHPFVQCFLASEENDFLRALPVRRLFSVTTIARAEGHVLDIRAGKVHASVLVGAADGSTLVTNPMRKVFNPKAPQSQLVWFRHEWVHKPKPSTATNGVDDRLTESGDENENENDIWQLPRPGISRITEGFKVDSMSFIRGGKGQGKLQEVAPFSTIYEEESAVTKQSRARKEAYPDEDISLLQSPPHVLRTMISVPISNGVAQAQQQSTNSPDPSNCLPVGQRGVTHANHTCRICGKAYDRRDLRDRHHRRCIKSSSKQKRKSCVTCARSKVKCNSEKPSCSRCVDRGVRCEYQAAAVAFSGPGNNSVGDDRSFAASALDNGNGHMTRNRDIGVPFDSSASANTMILNPEAQDSTYLYQRNASRHALGQDRGVDTALTMSGVDDTFTYSEPDFLALGDDNSMQGQWKLAPRASGLSNAPPGSQPGFSLLDNLYSKSDPYTPLTRFNTGASYDTPRLPSAWSTLFDVVWDDSSESVSPGVASEANFQSQSLRTNGQIPSPKPDQEAVGYPVAPSLSISSPMEGLKWPRDSDELVETIMEIPKLMLDSQYWPPFVHCSIYRCAQGEVAPPVAIALSCVGAFCNMLPASESFVYDMINRERENLVTSFHRYDSSLIDSLAALHGMIIYQILGLLYFHNRTDRVQPDRISGTKHAELHHPFLLKMSRRLCQKHAGILIRTELRGAGMNWKDWVLAETLRRTLFLVSLVNDLACRIRALNPIYYEELEPDLLLNLPSPSSDEIWTACTQDSWRAALAAEAPCGERPETFKELLARCKGGEEMNCNDLRFTKLSFFTRLLISGATILNDGT